MAINNNIAMENTSTPLHDIVLEKNIIASMMRITPTQIQELKENIDEECFYDTTCRELFKIFCKMNDEGNEITPMTVYPELMKSNNLSVDVLPELMPLGFDTYTSVVQHYKVLNEYSVRRKLWLIGHELINSGLSLDNGIDKVVEKVKTACDNAVNGMTNNVVTMQDTLKELTQLVDDNIAGKNKGRNTNTGFEFLDKKGGLQSSDLVIIAGATSQGKTSLANSIVMNALQEGSRIVFYSLEMTRLQLTSRMLSFFTKIYSNKMLTMPLLNEDLNAFSSGVGQMWDASSLLFFDDRSTSSIDSICNSIRRLKAKHGINGVVIDYIQLISGQEKGMNKEQFMASCARRFKNLAKELDIWIVALSQLNKDKDNPMPTLDRLRDSGQIAEAADMVLMVYRPQYYVEVEHKSVTYPNLWHNVNIHGTAMIILEKGRNVGTGSFICGFDSNTTHFYDLDDLPSSMSVVASEEERVKKEIQNDLPF